MPVLPKARYERFAQGIANGKDIVDAHADAGFKRNRGDASILSRNKSIQFRVQEILEERVGSVTQRLTKEAEYTRERLLAELERAYEVGEAAESGSAMTSAVIAKARILGLIIDRREVGDVGAFDRLTDEQLVEEAARLARSLGFAGPRLVEDDKKKSH
jgi:hypothetical protein